MESPDAPATAVGRSSGTAKESADTLFKQSDGAPYPDKDKPATGTLSGAKDGRPTGRAERLGATGRVPDQDDPDKNLNRAEQDAAVKLRQAVQRIKADRERRGEPVRGGTGSADTETKRDW